MNILSVYGHGQLLAASGMDGETGQSKALCLRSCGNASAFEVKRPETGGVLMLDAALPLNSYLASDHFAIETQFGVTRAVFIDSTNLLVEGPGMFLGAPEFMRSKRVGNRLLIGVREFFREEYLKADFDTLYRARAEFIESLPIPSEAPAVTRMALYKAFSVMKSQVNSPEGRIKHIWSTPNRWPHTWMWLWDSAFHAIGMRNLDTGLAKSFLSAVFDYQLEDGFIPHMMRPEKWSNITQPPILGLGIKAVYERDADRTWLAEVYPKLAAYLKWVFANRDRDGFGLMEWQIEDSPICRSGESGMDNSPRFDEAIGLDATDFNAYLAADCGFMAEFGQILGRSLEEVQSWLDHRDRLNRLINERLWNDTLGFYMDFDIAAGKQCSVMASSGFMPLYSGAASPEQAKRLVAHLADPETFGTPLGVPSVDRDCPRYSKDMWRGCVWINVNYLIALGLERYGYHWEADQLRQRTLREMEHYYMKYGTFFEFYDDRREVDPPQLLRKWTCDPELSPFHQVFFDYGWSACLYADMALGEIRTGSRDRKNSHGNVQEMKVGSGIS